MFVSSLHRFKLRVWCVWCEFQQQGRHDGAADIWALAYLFYYMMTGHGPFSTVADWRNGRFNRKGKDFFPPNLIAFFKIAFEPDGWLRARRLEAAVGGARATLMDCVLALPWFTHSQLYMATLTNPPGVAHIPQTHGGSTEQHRDICAVVLYAICIGGAGCIRTSRRTHKVISSDGSP
jgi:hypothetical protein